MHLFRRRSGVTVLVLRAADLITAADARTCCAQIEAVAARSRIITLDEAVRGLSREDRAVDHSVVITVDEGTAAFADIVMPALVGLHVPVALYLTTQLVEQQRARQSTGSPMCWTSIAEALTTGLFTLGSHGHTGATLARASSTSASGEINRSIELIATRTGRTPAHFAYPRAMAGSPEAREVVREHFHSAMVGKGRSNPVGRTDIYRLVRFAIGRPRRGSAPWSGALDASSR